MKNTLNPAQIGGFKIPRKPLPGQIQNQTIPAGIQQQGTRSVPHVAPGNSQASVTAPANLRSQAGTQGGPTEAMQETKPAYLYKKELEGAQKANVAERKEAKAAADGLLKEMHSLGGDVTRLESKIQSEQGKKLPSGERLAVLNTRLQARQSELSEKTGEYRDASKSLNHLEAQNVAINKELDNIRMMKKGKTPEAQAYQAERNRFKGIDPNRRELFTAGRQNPEIGDNPYRSHLADPGPATHGPMPGNTVPRVPFQATDATFDTVVDAKGVIHPEHLPAQSAPGSPRHSAESAGSEALPVYQYKQNLKELQPGVQKQITGERKMQEALRGEVISLSKAVGQKEQEIQRATASTMRPGSSRAGASLPQLHSELQGLKGQLAAKETEFSGSLTHLDNLNNLSGAVNTDLKNIRKDTALRFQAPVVPGEGFRSPLHFQSPIAPNPGRAEYRGDKAQFNAMSPSEKAEHLSGISGRQDPRVGLNPDRDILESRVTGQPIADRRTEEQKTKDKAESDKQWRDLSPEKKASFTAARIVEEGGERFQVLKQVAPQPGSVIIPSFDDMLRHPTSASALDGSMMRDARPRPPVPPSGRSQASTSGSGVAPQVPPMMSGALQDSPAGLQASPDSVAGRRPPTGGPASPTPPPSSMKGGNNLGSIPE